MNGVEPITSPANPRVKHAAALRDAQNEGTGGADKVAVYLPMSYQLGGFTVIVPRSRIREVPMKAEEALRFCVTAGVSRATPKNE